MGFVEVAVNDQSILMLSSVNTSSAHRLVGAVGAAQVDAWQLRTR